MPSTPIPREEELPPALIESIIAGECVAFVGAGFSAPAGLPGWKELLRGIVAYAKEQGKDPRDLRYVEQRIAQGGSHAYDEAAQILGDLLGHELLERIAGALQTADLQNAQMARRLAWLEGIPFRSILTTNFAPLLDGKIPAAGAYGEHLRARAPRWWSDRFWNPRSTSGAVEPIPTLKLHGDVRLPESLVLSRRGYRRNLYRDPGYRAFLRAIFAQQTVLFLGFSFTDAYLNELRSEALALFDYDQGERPIAYALVNDAPETMRKHYLQNEGVHLISFRSDPGFTRFDRLLEKLYEKTNPTRRFAKALKDCRILGVDPQPQNNTAERSFMQALSSTGGRPGATFVEVPDAAAAERLFNAGQRFDLVITHWGADKDPPMAAQVLERVRALGKEGCPVVVFSMPDDPAGTRRRHALALGAQDYLHRSEDLLRSIDRLLGGGMEGSRS